MGNLKQAIADKDATKATVNFTDADQAKQQAYNTAVTNAENIISKANGGNATQTEVEQAIQQVNAAKQALNGNAIVQHAKDEATALINNSNDLNQAQKDALKQQVQNATTVAGVNNVKQTAQELNNAMTQLKQGIADKEQTKADGNFVNADPDKQNAYNQAVAKAEALISGTPDVVVTPSEITAALNKVTQAKNDLNGNTNLATAKQNVQQAIDQLPNLNQAQRDEYNKQISQATLVPNVNAIQQSATTLNDAMTQLKQGIANKAQIKGSENYHDADTDKQTAYDNAVTKAEELLKQTTNPTMDPNTIQQALTKVNDTNQALNGNQKLADAKQAAKTNLGTLDHLNDAQKQALTTQVEQAPDIATVNNVKQNAQNLNNAMTNLSNALQDKTETLNSINFTDADQAKKDAYTNAVAHAEGILSKANGSNASQTEVEQAMQRVNEAKQALNGNDNVQRAKDAAKQVITNANDLNQAQKDALKQQVDAAQTVANVNTIKQTAQDLNQAMTQLKQGIADKDQTKANGNFVNADTDKQNAYNNAVAHAEQIISGTPNANVDPQQVAQALQQVTQAKGDLNGNHNLQVAKDNANTAINQLPNLNQPQKTALKDQVSHAELVTGVNAIKQNADALNNAMGTLKQQIQANSQVPQSVDFTQADQDKQQAYNNAANQAQQIANGTPTPVLTPDTVTQAVTTMNQAKDALNGDEKLAQAKQDALANLDTLRDLNQPQRDALRNQINQAQALATVEQTKQNAQNVNTAMGNLKQGIANKDTVKASENYHDADADKQTAYTNAVSQAEGIINQTTNPTLNPDEITRALTQVTDAKNGLNGEVKLATEKQNAKDAVNAMTHLNDAQKQALKAQIDQSPEIATVNQVKQTATSLDQAMNQLSQAINDKTQTLADGNYLNADPDKQNAYKQAVAKAEALLNKQSGTNEVQAQVESITNEVNAAKQALNGNDNLANAKQQAKQQLANLTHLNDAQKQSFESQITQAPLVTDVTTINQKAQALDHAMELLRNSIADNQATLASEDYHDATAQRQNDYNQAVTAAKNIINQTTSPTMNPDEVNRATTQVNNTKVALDGDENLAAAKQQANNRLNQLDHLNNAQKQQLQSQITQSSDIAAVNGHKQTAESLNTAMGNLINAIADHQAVEQRGNFINADTDKQNAYTTAVNEAEAMINKQTGQNANQTEVEQAITKVQTTLQALNGDHNLQVAKTNATQAIDALTSLNDPQKTALKDQVTAATLVTAVHQIEQNANTLNQAMHGLRESISDNAATKANSKYINENQPEQQNYDQAVQAANNIINEQTATLDNNAINQAATTVNTTKAALHGDVKLQNDKDHAKQALDKSTGQNLTAEQVIKLNDAVTAAKQALNGEERLNNRKSEALQRLDQLTHLNNAQRQLATQQINNAETLNKASRAINRATKLDNAMGAVQQYIDEQHLGVISSSNYINADDNLKANYDNAIANAAHELDKVQGNAIAKAEAEQLKQNIIDAQNALNGDQNLANAKDKANAFVNSLNGLNKQQQDLAHNAINNADTVSDVTDIVNNQIDLNNAMETLKHLVDNEIPNAEQTVNYQNADDNAKTNFDDAKRLANTLLNSDNTNVNDINGAIQSVNDAIQNLNGDQRLQDAKDKAIQSINQALANKLKEIEASNATDQDKLIAKNKAEELANSIINKINKATSNQDVSQVQTAGNQAIEQVHANEIPKAKIDANKDADKQVQALIDEIDRNPNLTVKEKQALKDRINQILQQGHNDINNAMTKEEIEQVKERLAQALQDIKDLVKAKEDAKNKIKALANAKRDQINSNPDLTPEQKAKALKEIDEAEKRALQNVENAQTIDQLNRGLNLGLDDIRNTHVWEVDDQPAVNEISEATPEQLLVNGELIVHRDDIITEQDVLAHINLIDQLTAEVIDTPSTATISDSLTAKVEVTLLDGSKVIVNVPVKVVEKELSVVKQQAIESIENAAQQKINEINNSVTLTLEQKEAAIAEVNKLKQQAIDHINNAPDVHSIEEIQQQEQAHIEQFNPEQFTIEQAKSNAIKSIEDAIQHMIDEIKARTDLTDKEKQEAIAKLNQLKEQAIQLIQRAQSIDEITEQLEQFKAQMKAANPTAKELAKRKQEAISKIKDFSNEKMNSIRNSEIGSADEKQAAMNRINEIVLETIRDINNAHTLQQVEAALNNGIARISAVQIVTSDRAKQSSSTGNESNSHLTIGYGTANHPFNSSTIGHKKKLDEDDDIDPLHMRHFSNNFGNVIKNAIGVVGISGLLASFWFFIAKRRRKEDEEEELEIRDNNKDSIKETLDDTKHLPLLFAKRRRKEDEEDVTVEEKDSLNNGESLDKVKHTPFFLPKRRRKEDEEDVEVTNENTDEKVLKDNEHSPLLIAKRRKDKEENVETTTSIESKDEDVPLLLAKKKNQKDNQSKGEKSASKKPSKKVAAKKKKKKSKKNKK